MYGKLIDILYERFFKLLIEFGCTIPHGCAAFRGPLIEIIYFCHYHVVSTFPSVCHRKHPPDWLQARIGDDRTLNFDWVQVFVRPGPIEPSGASHKATCEAKPELLFIETTPALLLSTRNYTSLRCLWPVSIEYQES